MTPMEFHDQVIETLSRVETQTKNIREQVTDINHHLGRLNGTVAEVISSVSNVRLDLTKHPIECKYGVQIEEVERRLSTGDHPGSKVVKELLDQWNAETASIQAAKDAVQKTSAVWMSVLKPIIWLGGGAILFLILTHLNELLKYYGIKP